MGKYMSCMYTKQHALQFGVLLGFLQHGLVMYVGVYFNTSGRVGKADFAFPPPSVLRYTYQ